MNCWTNCIWSQHTSDSGLCSQLKWHLLSLLLLSSAAAAAAHSSLALHIPPENTRTADLADSASQNVTSCLMSAIARVVVDFT
jgi:hypothetical protein